jgi:undecaprenyl-diphosphatase
MTMSRAIELLSTPDYVLMRRVNRWYPPRWFRYSMLVSSRAGDGALWVVLSVALLAVNARPALAALLSGVLAVFAGIALFTLIKRSVGRKRPCAIEAHCWANLLPPDKFSFPSGHTITAFAVLGSVGSGLPTLAPFLLFAAVCIAMSRIILGMHFLTDVLVGMMLGVWLGVCSFQLIAPLMAP